jgi:nitrogen regulatory protein PII
MKKIEATLQNYKLDEVKDALVQLGVEGLTITEIHDVGAETRMMTYRGVTKHLDAIPKVHIETIVPDRHVTSVVDTIASVARTGKEGDGFVLISDVLSVTQIRTGETKTTDEEFVRHEQKPQPAAVGRSGRDVPSYQHTW